MVEYEMNYLPPLEGLSLEDNKNGQIIDVGQSDEQEKIVIIEQYYRLVWAKLKTIASSAILDL